MDLRTYISILDAAEQGNAAALSNYAASDLENVQAGIPNWLASTSVEARATLREAISSQQFGGATASRTPSHPGRISNLPDLRRVSSRLAALSEIEKRAIVDEPGCASNVHMLDLDGTEYVDGELPLFL